METLKVGTMLETYDNANKLFSIPDTKYDEIEILNIERAQTKFLYTNPFLMKVNMDNTLKKELDLINIAGLLNVNPDNLDKLRAKGEI